MHKKRAMWKWKKGGPSEGRAAGDIEGESSRCRWCALRRFPRWIIETLPDRCHKRKAAERLKWRAFAFLIHYARGRFSPCPAPRRGLSWRYTKTSCPPLSPFSFSIFSSFFLFYLSFLSDTFLFSHCFHHWDRVKHSKEDKCDLFFFCGNFV